MPDWDWELGRVEQRRKRGCEGRDWPTGERWSEARPPGTLGSLNAGHLPTRRGGPGGRRQFGVSPALGGKRRRGWVPEASRKVAPG